MQPSSRTTARDRASDPRFVVGPVAKPPVFGRAAQTWLCLAALAVILYGTLGPMSTRVWLAQPTAWRWIPPAGRTDANDLLTNIVVYLPVGVALRLLVRRRGRAGIADLLVASALASGLSYGTELLQQFMPGRSANLVDWVVNSCAALAGAAFAVQLQWLIRQTHALLFVYLHVHRGLWRLVTWSVLTAVFVGMTMPWDFSRLMRPGGRLHEHLPWSVRRPAYALRLDQPLIVADPLFAQRFVVFATVGGLLAGCRLLAGKRGGRAFRSTVVRVAAFVVTVETAQVLLSEHMASVLQVLIAIFGGACGAAAAVALWAGGAPASSASPSTVRRRPPVTNRTLRRAALATLVLLVIATLLGSLTDRPWQFRSDPVFEPVPFRAHFHAPFARALTDIAQQLLLFGGLTGLCLLLTEGRARLAPLLLALGLVGAIECMQALLVGHGGDTTSLFLATAAWALALGVWDALYPRYRLSDAASNTVAAAIR